MREKVQAIIGLGSNVGNGRTILRNAWEKLGTVPGISLAGLSSPYMTAPVGMTSRNWFTNAVGRLLVDLSPLELLGVLLDLEKHMGRKRDGSSGGYQDRSLDLDLLYYGEIAMAHKDLSLPHPRIADRLFVLVPLAELAPEFRDCVSGKTVSEMTKALIERIAAEGSHDQEIQAGRWVNE